MMYLRALMRCEIGWKGSSKKDLSNFESSTPKDLVREYETPEGAKVREYGPFVYGYSMTVGPESKRVRKCQITIPRGTERI